MQHHCKSLHVVWKKPVQQFTVTSSSEVNWSKLNYNLHRLRIWPKLFFNNSMHWGIIYTFITKCQKYCLAVQVTTPTRLPQHASSCFFSAVRDKYVPAWPFLSLSKVHPKDWWKWWSGSHLNIFQLKWCL